MRVDSVCPPAPFGPAAAAGLKTITAMVNGAFRLFRRKFAAILTYCRPNAQIAQKKFEYC
jgi:hypothetical protein